MPLYTNQFEYTNGIIYQANCEEFSQTLAGNSIDFVCIDPPYTDGNKSILTGHKIQTAVDIPLITKEIYRILKPNTFYAVFGLMPTILAWYTAAIDAGFEFRIDIVWCKKKGGQGGNLRMKKSHELIYIFSKNTPNYYKTKGNYADVSQAQVEFNIKDIESIFRHLSYWKGIAQGKNLKSHATGECRVNDDYFFRKGGFKKEINSQALGLESLSFNTVWAFTSHNNRHRNTNNGAIKHPNVKPIPLIERLIELCTPDINADGKIPVILDFYMGSGTSALASLQTNRRYIGTELLPEYFEISQQRIEKFLTPSQHNIPL